jgi:hypothetical protein
MNSCAGHERGLNHAHTSVPTELYRGVVLRWRPGEPGGVMDRGELLSAVWMVELHVRRGRGQISVREAGREPHVS